MAILLSSAPDELGGTAAAAGDSGSGGLYPPMKDLPTRLSHVNKVPTTLGIGSSLDIGGGSGPGLSQDGSSLQQLSAMTPSSSSSSQSQVQMLRWLHMQQQYLLNQIQIGNLQSGSMPSLPLNLQDYQQLLGQHLVQVQKKQQHLTQQLKLASAAGPGGGAGASSTHHQTSLKLQQTQQVAAQINHQLALISQLSSGSSSAQHNAPSLKSQDLGSLGSPQIPLGATPSGGVMKHVGRSHSTSGMMVLEEGHESKGLMFGLQGLSLGGGGGGSYNSVSGQNSARNTSRLHQIISGSSSNSESLIGGGGNEGGSQGSMSSGGSQGSSPFSPPLGGNSIPPYSNGFGSGSEGPSSLYGGMGTPTTTNAAPSPFLSTGKSFSEIQEFKPGVPWQPRNQGSEPTGMQKQSSISGGGRMHDMYAQSPAHYGVSSPILDTGLGGGGAGGMGFSSRPFPGGGSSAGGSGMPHKYTRSNSTSGGFYRGGTGGYMSSVGGKRLPSPATNKYSIHYTSGGSPRSDVHQGGGGGGWNNVMAQDPPGIGGYGNSGHSHSRTCFHTGRPGNVQSPVNMGAGSSWKQPQQQQQFPVHPTGSRRIAPPSSLPPKASGGGGVYGSSKSIGGTPIGSHNSFYGSSSSSSGSSFSAMHVHPAEDKKWGAFPSTPGVVTPSTNMISNSVWGSRPLARSSNESLPFLGHKKHWAGTSGGGNDDRDMSRLWNQSLESDTVTVATNPMIPPTRPPGLLMNRGESSSSSSSPYNPPHGAMPSAGGRTSSASSSVTTPSFASGSSTWGQEEPHKEVFSPEPSFAEWQAGKKARLSISKLPSNMATSPWLIMRNVTSQVCI